MRYVNRKDIKGKVLKELPEGTDRLLKRYHGITGFELRRAVNYVTMEDLYQYDKASRYSIRILEGDTKRNACKLSLLKTINVYLKLKDFDEKYAPSRLYTVKEMTEIRDLLGLTNLELSYETVGSKYIIMYHFGKFNKTGKIQRTFQIHLSYHLNRLMDEKGISYE